MQTLRTLLLASLCSVVVACSTTQSISNGKASLPEVIPPGEGVVVLKLVGVTRPSISNAKFRTLTIKSIADGTLYDIQDVAPAGAADAVFAGSLPPGRYEIADLAAWGNAPGLLLALTVSDFQTVDKRLPPFEVSPGAVTNLGTVAMGTDAAKKELAVAVYSNSGGRESAITGLDARSRDKVGKLRQLVWTGAQSSNLESAAGFVKRLADKIAVPEIGPRDEILVGGPLGFVHSLGADRHWRSENIGSLESVVYVRTLPDGRIFAGTDNGRYYIRSVDGASWTEHRIPTDRSAVIGVEPLGGTANALQIAMLDGATLFGPTKYVIAIIDDIDTGQGYSEVLKFDEPSAYGRLPMYFDGASLCVAFNHVGLSRVADIFRIDPVTRTKVSETLDSWVLRTYGLADGTLAQHRMNGMSDYPAFSADGGKTWTRLTTAAPDSARFFTSELGYGSEVVSTGWSSVTSTLSKTFDRGESWKRFGTPFESSGSLTILRRAGGELIVHHRGGILTSADEGATWKKIWPSVH